MVWRKYICYREYHCRRVGSGTHSCQWGSPPCAQSLARLHAVTSSRDANDEAGATVNNLCRNVVPKSYSDVLQLDLAGSGIMGTLEDKLLWHGKAENKYIRAELYKLNVHGDSRCNMSAVSSCLTLPRLSRQRFVLQVAQGHPPRHRHARIARGHLSHRPRVRRARPPPQGPRMEVRRQLPDRFAILSLPRIRRVLQRPRARGPRGHQRTSSHRDLQPVSVDPAPNLEASIVTPNSKGVSNFQTALQSSLKSPEFLPDGGTLGFGLAHLYPVTFNTKLRELTSFLKGADADVYQACRKAQLQPLLQMIYDDRKSDYGGRSKERACPRVFN